MPRVPEVREERVQERAMTTGGGFETSSFGGVTPISAIGKATTQFMGDVERIATAEKAKADKIKVMEVERELSKYQDELLWNPQTGYYAKQGKDVMPASNEVIENFNKKVKDLEGTLNNDSQKIAFQDVTMRWAQTLNTGVNRHGFREAQKAEQLLTEATIKDEKNNAIQNYGDIQTVAGSIASIHKKIDDIAQSRGLPAEWAKVRKEADESEIHTRIIQQKVSDGDYLGAKAYFDNVSGKQKLIGQDMLTAQKLVRNGSVRGISQQITDMIINDNKYHSLGAALKVTEKIQDSDVRDAVVARVKSRFKDNEEQIKYQKEQLYTQAENFIKEKREVPVEIWTGLSLSQQSTLSKYANNRKNDDQKWLDFLDLNNGELRSMSRSEFQSKYWVNFDEKHRGHAERLWKQAVDGDPEVTNIISNNQKMKNAFIKAGLGGPKTSDWGTSTYNKFISFQEEAQNRLNQMGKKASPAEFQKVVDDLILDKVFVREFGRDPETPKFLLQENQKGSVYIPIKDIPPADAEKLKNLLKSKNKTVTDEKIEDLYGAFRTGNLKRKQEILGK